MTTQNHDVGNDQNLDPIAEALRRAASELTLRRGSHVGVVRRATRRQHRRRRAVAAGAVIAVGGGTVLTIQQLTRSTAPTLRSPMDDGTSVVDSVQDTADPSVPTPPPNDPSAAGTAVLVESDLVWTVVTPDTASAVGFTYGPVEVPGMVVSSAPGRNDNGVPSVVWRSDDGITWEQLDVKLPVGMLYNASFEGSRIYSVGTAPGIAATDPNPLLVATSVDAGSTWTTIELPIDSNANADLPFVRRAYATGQAAPISGGLLVAVKDVVEIDVERLEGLDLQQVFSWSAEGVQTQADPDCRPENQTSGLFVTTTTQVALATVGDIGGCALITRPWSDFGMPPETVAAMSDQPGRVFRIAEDGSFTEIAGPPTTGRLNLAGVKQGPNPVFHASDAFGQLLGWYRYLDDGTWQELQVPAGVYEISPAGDALVAMTHDGYTIDVAMSRDGSNWTRADLRGLYDEPTLFSGWQSMASAAGSVTMAVSAAPDPIATQGGAAITIGGVTARVDRAGGQVTITDAATSEPIDPALITDTDVGVSVADPDGGVRALFPMETLMSNFMSTPVIQPMHWDLVRTSDGVSFSRESIAELLGLTDDDISSVAHISTSGSKVIVAVTLRERDDDGIPKQLVLVGTPRG